MKSLKLITLIVLLYSCTPNVNNTIPTTNKSIKPSLIITSSPTIKPSSIPTSIPSITPSITISTPTPIPSPLSTQDPLSSIDKYDNIVKIYSLDDNIVFYKNINRAYLDSNIYKMLRNEKRRFSAEIYINGVIDNDVVLESSNPNIVFFDKGIAYTNSNTGEADLKAYSRKNPNIKASLKIQVLDTLIIKTPQFDKDCNTIYVDSIMDRFKYASLASSSASFNSFGILDYGDSLTATFNGKVYDPNGVPVSGARVSANVFYCNGESSLNWSKEFQETVGGAYVFTNNPVGIRISITVTKDGWTTRTRNEILKSNLQGDPLANVFDFSGVNAIQDEPEIISLKVNGQQILSSSKDDVFATVANAPKNSKPTPDQMSNDSQLSNIGNIPSLTGVKGDKLEVEMTFSEPIKIADIQNYFRITSQSGFDNKTKIFSVDANYSGVLFDVSTDEKTVTFKTNKGLLSNKSGEEARYLIDFSQAFRDKTDKAAIDRRYFRFSSSQMNDFAVFSVKNDEVAPKLLGITAKNGVNGGNDTIELRYSEPMELINQASYPAGLSDPLAPSNLSRQLWYRDANDVNANSVPIINNTNDNNATLVGFLNGSDTDINQFRASYMIGRVLASEISSQTNNAVKMSILGNKDRIPNTKPVKGNTIANDLLRNAKITGSTILLEFSPDAFDKDDRVVVSVGNRITGNFVDRNRVPSVNDDLSVSTLGTGVEYSPIYDPAGRLVDGGDSSGPSQNIDVNYAQRVTTAN